jgi:hypothetical protein
MSTSGGIGPARLDMEPGRFANAVEQQGLGRGHPHLASRFEAGEEGCPAFRIEMRGDFVEEEDRGLTAPLCDELGMGEDEAEEQRLLLSGRGSRCGHLLHPVQDDKILAMRAFDRPCRRGIALAI